MYKVDRVRDKGDRQPDLGLHNALNETSLTVEADHGKGSYSNYERGAVESNLERTEEGGNFRTAVCVGTVVKVTRGVPVTPVTTVDWNQHQRDTDEDKEVAHVEGQLEVRHGVLGGIFQKTRRR